MQRAARSTEPIDSFGHFGIFDEWRRVVRFDPRVDQQRTATAPVLFAHKLADAVHVGRPGSIA